MDPGDGKHHRHYGKDLHRDQKEDLKHLRAENKPSHKSHGKDISGQEHHRHSHHKALLEVEKFKYPSAPGEDQVAEVAAAEPKASELQDLTT